MPNTLITSTEITREALMVLKNNCKAIGCLSNRWDDQFGQPGHKIGSTLMIRKPPRFIGTTSSAYTPEAITDTQVPLTLNLPIGVHLEFTDIERKLSLDDFSRRVITPAAIAIGNIFDAYVLQFMAQNTWNNVGTPGTTPTTTSVLTYAQAGQKIQEAGAPQDDRLHMLISPAMRVNYFDNTKALYNDQTTLGKLWKTGIIGQHMGYNWYMDQNCYLSQVGPLGGSPTVNAAGQTGSSLVTNGWTAAAASRLLVGDRFTIGSGTTGVYAVNPQSRQSNRNLQAFVVTAPASSDASGNVTISIAPSITPSGQFQNVDSTPQASATINMIGSANTFTVNGILLHEEAYGWASVNLDKPNGVDDAHVETDPETKMTLRYVRQWDNYRRMFTNRLECLVGVVAMYPELSCVIYSGN